MYHQINEIVGGYYGRKSSTKRKFSRVDMIQRARLDFEHRMYDPCHIKNLSLSGMFIFGRCILKKGDECTISFNRTCSATHIYFKAKAKVVRTTGEGIAIEFISMSFDSYMSLQTTLLWEADDPLAICLEIPEECPQQNSFTGSKKSKKIVL